MSGKKTTMQDIADYLGISKSLVSLALSDSPLVNEKRKAEVRHAAYTLNYTAIHRKIKKKPSNNAISVYVPYSILGDNEFGMKIIAGVENALSRLGMRMTLLISEDSAPPSAETSRGVIVYGYIQQKQLELIEESGLPIVFIDFNPYTRHIDCVMASNYDGMFEATEYIINCGHRKLIFVGNNMVANSFNMRYHGCKDAVFSRSYLFPVECRYVTDSILGKLFDEESFCRLLDSDYQATAIICANDPIALQIYPILESRGLRIPEDISVIGFDNIQQSSWVNPPLSTVNLDKCVLAEEAVRLLMEKIQNPSNYHRIINIDVNLVERQSVKKLDS